MKIRYLLDENIGIAMLHAVQRLDGRIDITRVGSPGAPPLGTLDPDILLFCEREERALVTDNRHSMGKHITDHFLAGAENVKNGIIYIT